MVSAICNRMKSGVFLFYGVTDIRSRNIIRDFTRTFHMPYLSPSTAPLEIKPQQNFEIHMKPDYSLAIIDMIEYFGWPRMHYLYDSDDGLNRLQMVLAALRNTREGDYSSQITVIARRLYNVENAHDELRQMDRMVMDDEKVFVFDLSSERAYRSILKQIPEVGMNKEGYHYLVATLDFINLDMQRYLHGGVNITGFQLLNFENPALRKFIRTWNMLDPYTYPGAGKTKLTYEAALAVDVIDVITRSLRNMVAENPKIFQSTFRRKEVYNYNRTQGIPCNTKPPVPWMHGNTIMDEIKELDFEGLTGRIRFDENGFRKDYELNVFTVGLDTGPFKIGTWDPVNHYKGLYDQNDEDEDNFFNVSQTNRPKIISTILSSPFLMLKEAKDGQPLVGNNRFEGYTVDLTKEVADIVRFDYEFQLVKDDEYGRYINNTWTGMIGEVYRREADMAIGPITITYEREAFVDFSKPFMNVGISIMIKKPEIQKPGVFSFMEPLSPKIWICILCAYIGVSVGLFLVSRFSPYEWEKGSGDEVMENQFNILNALWFSVGALMLQGSDACPRSFSGRIIGTVWWFFVLIIISSYTANLAAFLTIERMHTPIESADDLAKQTEIKYGTIKSGTTMKFFEESKVQTYRQMWNFMSAENPSVFVKDVKEGVDRVKSSKGKYAFLLESSANEFYNNREPCDTMKVGPNLNSKGLGIATTPDSPIKAQMNLAVLELTEDGTLHKLKTKWWKDKGQCAGNPGDASSKRELSLSNVAGIFYILIAGLVFAVILASFEFICEKSKMYEKVSYMTATETVTTLVMTPTSEKENGGPEGMPHSYNTTENQQATFSYKPQPAIGFEHFMREMDHTEL
ncbi:hypothetical protein CHS0354_042068 [Potamilus streckersoni]|nr:hypothetical protein CHS0354_042068 [Potamilus streckersoni]